MNIIKRKSPFKTGVWKGAVIALLPLVVMVAFSLPVMSDADTNLYTANWLKSPDPIQGLLPGNSGAWDDTGVGVSCVIYDNQEFKFKMWYTGYDSDDVMQIGYATSDDGTSWTKYTKYTDNDGGPVLQPGGAGAWDEKGVGSPSVVKDVGGTYHMWYTGYKEAAGNKVPQIGYATSSNGTSWTKYNDNGGPVLQPGGSGAWDEKGVHSCFVMYDTEFKMWYTGRSGDPILGNSAIGYATFDGTEWDKYDTDGGPVLEKGASGAWDERGAAVPSVLKANSKYTMWYSGYSGTGTVNVAIGVAQSADGITGWAENKNALPVLKKEATAGLWNSGAVGAPLVAEATSSKLVMWYSGVDSNLASQVGLATVETVQFGGTVTLQGKDRPYPAGFDVPLTLKLYDTALNLTSSNILTASPMFTFSTDTGGGITATPNEEWTYGEKWTYTVDFSVDVPSGSYKATLYTPHALINLKEVTITSTMGTVNMGALHEGNADESDQITGADFSLLLNDYASTAIPSHAKWNGGRCDFDRSGNVDSVDFSLMSMNYNDTSPLPADES